MASQPTRYVTYPPLYEGLIDHIVSLNKALCTVPLISGGGYVRGLVGWPAMTRGETRLFEGRVPLDVVGPKSWDIF